MEPAIQLWECLCQGRFLRFVASSANPKGWNGVGTGTVVVECPAKTVLTFKEAGSWAPTIGKETRFKHVFRWSLAGPAVVRLEHLRFGADHPVYLFDLAPTADSAWSSATPHLCREDCYSAELRRHEWGMFLHWTIVGPKKQESIEYDYRWDVAHAEPGTL